MSLSKWLVLVAGAAAVLTLSGCGLMRGSDYPNRNITFIIPYAPGGSTDPLGRFVMQKAEPALGVKVDVLNRPGATATLGTSEVVQSKPDGYTLGLGTGIATTVMPHTMKLPYAGPDTYQPIVGLSESHDMLCVRADSRWKNLDDFIADVKSNPPNTFTVGTSGVLNGNDTGMVEFSRLVGVEVKRVPFSGGAGEIMQAMLGGHIDAGGCSVINARGLVEAGQIRVLAGYMWDPPEFPGVQSFPGRGYKLTNQGLLMYIMGPKGLDKPVMDKLAKVFLDVANSPEWKKWCADNGQTLRPEGPEQLTKRLQQHYEANGKLIKDLNLAPPR